MDNMYSDHYHLMHGNQVTLQYQRIEVKLIARALENRHTTNVGALIIMSDIGMSACVLEFLSV